MVIWLGTACFGTVLGWVCVSLYRCGEPGWRELKVLSAIAFGAVLQACLGNAWREAAAYVLGLLVGTTLCGVLLPARPARLN